MMGEIATRPLPFNPAEPNIRDKAAFVPGLSRASFLMEKMLSLEELSAKGPSGEAVSCQLPMGLTTLEGVVGSIEAGTSLAPSEITPAQSPICIFIRIFSAM